MVVDIFSDLAFHYLMSNKGRELRARYFVVTDEIWEDHDIICFLGLLGLFCWIIIVTVLLSFIFLNEREKNLE